MDEDVKTITVVFKDGSTAGFRLDFASRERLFKDLSNPKPCVVHPGQMPEEKENISFTTVAGRAFLKLEDVRVIKEWQS